MAASFSSSGSGCVSLTRLSYSGLLALLIRLTELPTFGGGRTDERADHYCTTLNLPPNEQEWSGDAVCGGGGGAGGGGKLVQPPRPPGPGLSALWSLNQGEAMTRLPDLLSGVALVPHSHY